MLSALEIVATSKPRPLVWDLVEIVTLNGSLSMGLSEGLCKGTIFGVKGTPGKPLFGPYENECESVHGVNDNPWLVKA